MMAGLIGARERWKGDGALGPMRSVTIRILTAAIALPGAGCVTTPGSIEPDTTAVSAVTRDGGKSSTPDQAPVSDPKSEFHANATDRQQFKVHIDFGRAFEAQGNLDAAVREYQDALTVIQNKRRGPFRPADEALAHRRMGSALDRLGRFAQAETHYKKALNQSPKDPKIWNDMGYSYYLQGRWTDSESALQTAIRLAPDDDRIRTNLGLTLAAAGRIEEALPLLSQSNGDATGHANLGYLLAATGQLDLARRQYETALALQPDLQLARRALARIDLKQPGSRSPAPAPALAAGTMRSPAAYPVDSSVNKATMASAKIAPPLPNRVLPQARAASVLNSAGPPAPSPNLNGIRLPPLPELP